MPILEALIQQGMAPEEIHQNLWQQGQIDSLYEKRQAENMILKNLKILSQNICKNHLIVNTILETQSHFDIILIQEPSWSVICKVSSTSSSEGKNLIGTVHHPNWLLFAINPMNKVTSPRVTAYINIHLSSLCFSLWSDIINHTDILLISFTNNHTQYFIMNIYSESSHSALKYLKDIEVNIDNVLVMTGNFNIRDSLRDPAFPHHLSISNNLLIITDSFHLALSMPTDSYPTRYSDIAGEANLTIDLMFLQYGSTELNQHSIHPDWWLTSDHTPLSITIPIVDETINTSKLLIQQNSKQETVFIEEVISVFKNLNTLNISNKECLKNMVNNLNLLINQAWNTKQTRITRHSKKWWTNECKKAINKYRASRSLEN